jgi:hypothetical protein
VTVVETYSRACCEMGVSRPRARNSDGDIAEYLPHLPRQSLYAMKTRIITMAGIGFCSLFFTTIATLGQTVAVPASRMTFITEVPAPPTVNTFVKALDNDRYQLIEKRDNKEVYRDTQTGEKWILEIHHRNG